MSITFHPYTPNADSDLCLICYEAPDSDAVAHGKENFHQMCRKCAQQWLEKNPTCPGCRQKVNTKYILPFKRNSLLNSIDSLHDTPISGYTLLAALGTAIPVLISIQAGSSSTAIISAIVLGALAGLTAGQNNHFQNPDVTLYAAVTVSVIVLNCAWCSGLINPP